MQKYRFNIGRFELLFGTDYIGSYCLEGPIHFGIAIGPGARTGNRPNASSDSTMTWRITMLYKSCDPMYQFLFFLVYEVYYVFMGFFTWKFSIEAILESLIQSIKILSNTKNRYFSEITLSFFVFSNSLS